jgi:hypothetical protein
VSQREITCRLIVPRNYVRFCGSWIERLINGVHTCMYPDTCRKAAVEPGCEEAWHANCHVSRVPRMAMFCRCYAENKYSRLCLINKDNRSTMGNVVYLFYVSASASRHRAAHEQTSLVRQYFGSRSWPTQVPWPGSKDNSIGSSIPETAATAGCWRLVFLDEWAVYRTCTGT